VSVYTINEVCYRSVHDQPFREALLADPAGTLATLDLTDGEREAFMTQNVGQLYLWGANTFLLGHLMRYKLFGVEREQYSKSIWATARSLRRHQIGF